MKLAGRGATYVLAVIVAAGMSLASEAQAQTAKEPSGAWAAQADGGLTVGHQTSSAVGFEVGYWATDSLKIFVESSWMQDVSSAALDERADVIAGAIGATSNMKEAATVIDLGVRYSFRQPGTVRPFILGGFGLARVDVQPGFTINGDDITGSLPGYGVRLGLDLDGTVNKGFVVLGGGVNMPLNSRSFVEGSVRYGYIFPRGSAIPDDTGTNTTRLQLSFGVRF